MTNVAAPSDIQPTTTSEILDVTQVKLVDTTYVKNENVMEKVNELVEEKKKILSRHFQLLKQEIELVARRVLKEELDNRLSDMMTDTHDKEELKRQEDAYKDGIVQLAVIMSDINSQFDNLMEKYPHFSLEIENRKKDLEFIELEHELELQKEAAQVAMRDHGDHLTLLERMASTIKPYYMQLKGHGLLSTKTIKEYDHILTAFKGKKNLKRKNNLDSGVSSSTSIDMPVDQVKVAGSKRKKEEDDDRAHQSSPPLDRTFPIAVLSPMPKPLKEPKLCSLNAQQIIAKVCGKQMAQKCQKKENMPAPRSVRVIRTRSAARMNAKAKVDTGLRAIAKSPSPRPQRGYSKRR
ncbi:unnamed protein product [Acanthoscelides obtectus]|uniref:Uncharacterized protein n=1 Tax=Acanthoscelides obtectus TaxID=200917 RepID=A0A9P0LWV3_ACAOB|nr:unnamed protein product [Acanthoscelides obtectus]CAK1621400.1 hypothetical protein AOBTE_LOCUS929 [Acanthoscelides obtectus]